MSQQRVLLTGGAGYIGSVLVGYLLERGFDVTVLDNFRYQQTSLNAYCHDSSFHVVNGDCRDHRLVRPLVELSDIILPLAAIVGADACDRDMEAAVSTNSTAARTICNYASPSQVIIYPNTNSGYGRGGQAECTEEDPLEPLSLYGREKAFAENIVMMRENSISLRLATVFGVSPRMRTDLLVNDFVQRAVNDRAVIVFEGHFRRNYIHVTDVARGFIHAIDKFQEMRGKVYNLGDSAANMTKLQLCARIKEHLPAFVYMESAVGSDPDKRDYLVSNARIEATGYKTLTTIDSGIKELQKLYEMIRARRYGNT